MADIWAGLAPGEPAGGLLVSGAIGMSVGHVGDVSTTGVLGTSWGPSGGCWGCRGQSIEIRKSLTCPGGHWYCGAVHMCGGYQHDQ